MVIKNREIQIMFHRSIFKTTNVIVKMDKLLGTSFLLQIRNHRSHAIVQTAATHLSLDFLTFHLLLHLSIGLYFVHSSTAILTVQTCNYYAFSSPKPAPVYPNILLVYSFYIT